MGNKSFKDVWGECLMDSYKDRYIFYCADLNNGYTKKDVKKHNAAMKELAKLFYELKDEPDKSFLLDLMQHNDDQTKLLVAAHCLGLNKYVEEAKAVLSVISKNKTDPVLAFEAQSTLDVWKQQGYLKF